MINDSLTKTGFFFLSKILKLIVILFAVCIVAFMLVQSSPVDPVRAYVGADMLQISQAQQEVIAKKWGLNDPPQVKFFNWIKQLVQGDFGTSMIYNDKVVNVIGKRFLTSITLMIVAWILSGIIGFIFGIISGVYKNSIVSKIIDIYSYVLASTPTFWLAIVFLIIFSVVLQWTPISGATPAGILPENATILQFLHHLILPAVTLSFISIANVTLHTKEKVVELMQDDFVTFARAQGESTFGIIKQHIVRNSMLPALSLQFASINEIFGGSVLVEQVFSYPGLGKATVDAGIRGDVPLLLGITIFTTIFVFTGNALADFFYKVVDPRIRFKENVHE
jgi:peptide/nickel transport system permease protein